MILPIDSCCFCLNDDSFATVEIDETCIDGIVVVVLVLYFSSFVFEVDTPDTV